MLAKMERYGCAKSVVGLVIPAGYSFNLDGTSIYLSMASIFIAQAFNIHLGWAQQLQLLGVLMLTSKGAAGVTGSGFIVLASTLSALQGRADRGDRARPGSRSLHERGEGDHKPHWEWRGDTGGCAKRKGIRRCAARSRRVGASGSSDCRAKTAS
jgi:hypothetical protein